jgi:hypothetical protein
MSLLDIAHHVRQNHALEHATMHVLARRNPYARLVARSMPSGFVVYGSLETQDVAAAASEALSRLQAGEDYLAVHPRCGTNLAVTGVMAGAAAFGVSMGRTRSRFERLPLALAAATLAAVIAQPLGHRFQERVTTTPDVDGLYIDSVTRQQQGNTIRNKVAIGRE